MRDKDDVYEAKGNDCRFQMTGKVAEDNFEKESRFMSNSERFVLSVLNGLKMEIDSAKAIGSMEIGVTCEERSLKSAWRSCWMCSTPSVGTSRSQDVESVERARFHESGGRVP